MSTNQVIKNNKSPPFALTSFRSILFDEINIYSIITTSVKKVFWKPVVIYYVDELAFRLFPYLRLLQNCLKE